MDLKKRLESCTKCEKRKFGDTGIVCSLTGNKPTFNNTCNDFKIDAREAQKMIARARYENYDGGGSSSYQQEEKSSNPIWTFIVVIIIIVRLVLLFAR